MSEAAEYSGRPAILGHRQFHVTSLWLLLEDFSPLLISIFANDLPVEVEFGSLFYANAAAIFWKAEQPPDGELLRGIWNFRDSGPSDEAWHKTHQNFKALSWLTGIDWFCKRKKSKTLPWRRPKKLTIRARLFIQNWTFHHMFTV